MLIRFLAPIFLVSAAKAAPADLDASIRDRVSAIALKAPEAFKPYAVSGAKFLFENAKETNLAGNHDFEVVTSKYNLTVGPGGNCKFDNNSRQVFNVIAAALLKMHRATPRGIRPVEFSIALEVCSRIGELEIKAALDEIAHERGIRRPTEPARRAQ